MAKNKGVAKTLLDIDRALTGEAIWTATNK